MADYNDMKAMFEFFERDRNLSREEMCRVLEASLQVAARRAYGRVRDVRVSIDRHTLAISVFASRQVVEFVRNREEEISIDEADIVEPAKAPHRPGQLVEQQMSMKNLGRIAAQTAKQAITQHMQRSTMERVLDLYRNRVGELVTGTIAPDGAIAQIRQEMEDAGLNQVREEAQRQLDEYLETRQ